MSDILKLFGNRVREIRKDQGLSQEELAEKAELHHTYIGGVERGERNLSLKSIEKIARALKIPINIFLKKRDKFVVSEDSVEKFNASFKKSGSLSQEQELLQYFNSLKNDELKNSIITLFKIISNIKQ